MQTNGPGVSCDLSTFKLRSNLLTLTMCLFFVLVVTAGVLSSVGSCQRSAAKRAESLVIRCINNGAYEDAVSAEALTEAAADDLKRVDELFGRSKSLRLDSVYSNIVGRPVICVLVSERSETRLRMELSILDGKCFAVKTARVVGLSDQLRARPERTSHE